MEREILIPIIINPLLAMFADPRYKALRNNAPTVEEALAHLCDPNADASLEAIIARYQEAKDEPHGLIAAPNEPRILERLVWPLRNAKSSYMLGNYLGTIALCGMVTEMIAILLFEMSNIRFKNGPMTETAQKALFGSAFEKLGQERRVAILHELGLLNDATKLQFEEIRTLRKRYLHLWSHSHETLASDAVKCYQAALAVVVTILGQDIKDGRIVLNPILTKYLQGCGLLTSDDTTRTTEPCDARETTTPSDAPPA